MSFSDRTLKYATCAGVGGLAYTYLTKSNGSSMLVNIGGSSMEVPTWAAGMVSGGLASVVADAVHNSVLPTVPMNEQMGNMSSAILTPVAAGAVYPVSQYLMNSKIYDEVSFQSLFVAGVISELVAQYVYVSVVAPDNVQVDDF